MLLGAIGMWGLWLAVVEREQRAELSRARPWLRERLADAFAVALDAPASAARPLLPPDTQLILVGPATRLADHHRHRPGPPPHRRAPVGSGG